MGDLTRSPGFYVDVGAHSPRRGNNTYWLYRRGWRGILIDIEDEKVLACKLARPRDIAVNAAISNREGQATVYANKSFSTTATIIPHVEYLDRQAIARDVVRVTTLTSLLTELSAPKTFGLLSIDTEGSDLNVLLGLDFEQFKPIYICVEEIIKEDILEILHSELHRYLTNEGYQLVSVAGYSLIYRLGK